MSNQSAVASAVPLTEPKRLAFFERYLTVWVLACMVVGVAFGKLLPDVTATLSRLEFGQGSQVNVPIGVLLWLMIYPMMLKVDFGAIGGIAQRPKGLMVTLFVNWLVKPFSMALLAWIFMQHVFAAWIGPEMAKQYTAGLIILAAAPCTAMVFVWSYLTDGDPAYTLVQVAVNDLIMLVAFAPIVMFLCGVAHVVVPAKVLITSVVVFIVIPLAAGVADADGAAEVARQGVVRGEVPAEVSSGDDRGAAADAGADLRVPGGEPDQPLGGGAADRGADYHPGLFQLRADLPADAVVQGGAQCGVAGGADRGEQLLRAGGGGGDHAVRAWLRRGAGDGGGGAGGGAGDAFGVQRVQPDAGMVWGRGRGVEEFEGRQMSDQT